MPAVDHTEVAARRAAFVDLHRHGSFVMPNAWDVGSARILATLGFPAIATTSSGHAASLGRLDQHVSLDELVAHAATLVAAVDVPVSVDAERCFADDADGIAATVARLDATGAAGLSIEDWHPAEGIDPLDVAVARVAAAAAACDQAGMVLTARAENHLYGVDDLDDTIARMVAYREAGATCLYAPGLVEVADLARVVEEVGGAINVLALPGAPSVPELADLGVRRVSTGGALAGVAYGGLVRAGRELLDTGTTAYLDEVLPAPLRDNAFARATPDPSRTDLGRSALTGPAPDATVDRAVERTDRCMAELNHTIVHVRDKAASARFYVELLGLDDPVPFGPFLVVETANGVSLDFADDHGEVQPQHYAFLVSEDEFDAIFGRIGERGLDHWADPGKRRPGEINHNDGGRGVYWDDPDGHILEIITRPYGSGG